MDFKGCSIYISNSDYKLIISAVITNLFFAIGIWEIVYSIIYTITKSIYYYIYFHSYLSEYV